MKGKKLFAALAAALAISAVSFTAFAAASSDINSVQEGSSVTADGNQGSQWCGYYGGGYSGGSGRGYGSGGCWN